MEKSEGKNLRMVSLVLGLGLGFAASAAAIAAPRLTILSEGGATGIWRLASGSGQPLLAYPSSIADQGEDVCIGVGYLLNPDGSTSDLALLSSWGSRTPEKGAAAGHFDLFAQYAAAAVGQWRFVPVAGGRAKIKPVYTAATFVFTINGATEPQELRARCVIEDLPGFVAKARDEAYEKGDMNKAGMQADRVQNPPIIPPHQQR